MAGPIVLLVVLLSLIVWRSSDRKADSFASACLIAKAGPSDCTFEPSMVEGLPEPAQRYFLYTIRPGAPLHHAVEIEMGGELGFGNKAKPNYRSMSAHQILAPPHGLIWKLVCGPISGSDGLTSQMSWTRFWLFGLIPIVRVGGHADHRRSAFGRVVAEGAFWAPASLLPSDTVKWEAVDQNCARAVVHYGNLRQAVDITVAADGQPTQVVIQRWSNENTEREFREQPFGGYLSGFDDFGGYRLPTQVEGGNHIGTDAYFPFYKAVVTAVRFPGNVIAP